jgi:hypothetical protein
MIARFIIAASQPWSREIQICFAVVAGLTAGILIGVSGRI